MTTTRSRPYPIGQILGVAGGIRVDVISGVYFSEDVTCAGEKLVAQQALRCNTPQPPSSVVHGRPGDRRWDPATGCDVSVAADVDVLFSELVPSFGGLDVLVNNAQSTPPNRRLQDVPMEDVELALGTGPVATFRCMQGAFPHLRERGGSIVNLGSNTAIEGAQLFGAYAMAKEGIRGLSRVAAQECGRFGIPVNGLSPFGDSAA